MADEDFRKHLDLIQGVISRLAGNSFTIKAWSVGLIAVLGSLAAKDANPRVAWALLLPAICFWGLDAYYLAQERLYRGFYAHVIATRGGAVSYSLDASACKTDETRPIRCAFSQTALALHLPIFLFVIGLIAYSCLHRSPQVAETTRPCTVILSK